MASREEPELITDLHEALKRLRPDPSSKDQSILLTWPPDRVRIQVAAFNGIADSFTGSEDYPVSHEIAQKLISERWVETFFEEGSRTAYKFCISQAGHEAWVRNRDEERRCASTTPPARKQTHKRKKR